MISGCRELEGALEDILRPVRAVAGVFWALHSKPQSAEDQTIIDLCMMMEQVANQITYLIEHAKIDGKSVAFALIDQDSVSRN
jgi:hypothetical protein